MIIKHLARIDIQNMRFVCKEFESKVSEHLFRHVVVPFKPEIYGIKELMQTDAAEMLQSWSHSLQDRHLAEDDVVRQGAVMLQDDGMRTFQGFGRHITKFAMSFEVDYSTLKNPPIKSDQEAITTFWGIYRWPFKNYNRYSQLEGLEQAADETRTMAQALRYVSKAKELGLSIDGGLGWLSGPDINPYAPPANSKPPVFGNSRCVVQEAGETEETSESRESTLLTTLRDRRGQLVERVAFQRMLREAGYEGEDLERSVLTLLASEGLHQQDLSANAPIHAPARGNGRRDAMEQMLRGFGYDAPVLERVRTYLHGTEAQAPNRTNRTEGQRSNAYDFTLPTVTKHDLSPAHLTNAQREMLLEVEWAQRAFMQSYAIAIIDNSATFQAIRTLKIARLPSRHLSVLSRDDFWDSLPQLVDVSLAVIPDWRDINKLPTGWVQDDKIAPSTAVKSVYSMLQNYVGMRESIKNLHFEWICGGEEAPGLFARNQLVLPAPILSKATDMARADQHGTLISLPYVENLTLKNCWCSPHILVKFVNSHAAKSLQLIRFNSFSISAPVGRNGPQPQGLWAQAQQFQQGNPIQFQQGNPNNFQQGMANNFHLGLQHAHNNFQAANGFHPGPPNVQNLVWQPMQGNGNFLGMAAPLAPFAMAPAFAPAAGFGPAPFVAPPAPPAPAGQAMPQSMAWMDRPRPGSWPHVIENITPGKTLAVMRYENERGPEPAKPKAKSLKTIIFESCGNVTVPLEFDNNSLLGFADDGNQESPSRRRRTELESHMMKPNDNALGTIVNYMRQDDIEVLENAWGLEMGWDAAWEARLKDAALEDGVSVPGRGRFRGTIEATSDDGESPPAVESSSGDST